MKIISTAHELRSYLKTESCAGKSVGFVPTMGALHDGHGSLVRRSVEACDLTVASIFVNPTQFGPGEDLDKYPRTFEADCQLLEALGCDCVFVPEVKEMYGEGEPEFFFGIRTMNRHLCGEKRPGHFEGVVQIVSKLFNIVRPDKAFFGRKDFQQVAVIRRMVEEFSMDVEIVPCPIIREADGLAMSSRNVYLGPEERKQALFLSKTLKKVAEAGKKGQNVAQLRAVVREMQRDFPLARLDYFEVVNGRTLEPVETIRASDEPVALIAAFLGKTRLIDNQIIFS